MVVKTYGEEIVGHVPLELSKIFWKFISEHGDIEAECIGDRYNAGEGKGLELPVDYKFAGNKKYIDSLHKKLVKKNNERANKWNISNVLQSEFNLKLLK